MRDPIHIIPVGLAEPMHHAHHQCWCSPLLKSDENQCIHHAKDGREKYERQGHVMPGDSWVLVKEGPAHA